MSDTELPKSIVDPAAEEAHRHLSWTPESQVGHVDARDYDHEATLSDARTYTSYTGYPDGTFEVNVGMERDGFIANQSERGVGETGDTIKDAMLKAYEKADRALNVLLGG